MRRLACTIALALVAAWTSVACGGVNVVEDEVVFTLKAPGATEVFLVGEFNNWNPTVERMERDGDTFAISLFLVEGTYRYKFVVDGVWIVDPDNPGPEKGSILTLEERAGGYALSTDEPEPDTPVRTVTPRLRYIGLFDWDGGDGDAQHIADLYFDVERPHLNVDLDLQSLDHTWKWSPPSADIDVVRASARIRSGAWNVAGFENDSLWTSRGPVTLIGRDGVYDYDAGFDRHGVSVTMSPSSLFLLRGFYADRTGDDDAPAARIPAASVAAAGTTAYAFALSAGDTDQAAFELAFDSRDIDVGYVRRFDRGLHAGVLADVSDDASSATVYATREDRDATLYWLGLRDVFGFGTVLGYGRGSSDVRLTRRGVTALGGDGVTADAADGDADSRLPLLESDRVAVELTRTLSRVSCRAWWDYTAFDFDSHVYAGGASSDVHRAGAGAAFAGGAWSAAFAARYTDQVYRDTPADLHIDSPARNIWLFGRDEFTVGDIAALGIDRYFDANASVGWSAHEASAQWVPSSAALYVSTTTDGIFDRFAYLEARAALRFEVAARYYAALDGRAARYDREAWGGDGAFFTGWVEAGARYRGVDVNIGWGFDPVVFDPVANDFADIGREEWLRGAIAGGVHRDDTAATGTRLVELERALEAAGVIKLECVVRF